MKECNSKGAYPGRLWHRRIYPGRLRPRRTAPHGPPHSTSPRLSAGPTAQGIWDWGAGQVSAEISYILYTRFGCKAYEAETHGAEIQCTRDHDNLDYMHVGNGHTELYWKVWK